METLPKLPENHFKKAKSMNDLALYIEKKVEANMADVKDVIGLMINLFRREGFETKSDFTISASADFSNSYFLTFLYTTGTQSQRKEQIMAAKKAKKSVKKKTKSKSKK